MKKLFYKSIALLFVAASLSSCLKDDTMVLDPEKALPNTVEFGNTGTPSSPATAPVFAYTPLTLNPVAEQTFETSVRYAGIEDVAPQDIVVNLAAAPEAITKWNLAFPNATAAARYNMLPENTYSFPSTVTIKKGEKSASFTVTVKPTMLNAAQSNVLGIKITSASHGTVSGNFGTVIYNLPIKSLWDGTYLFKVVNTNNNDSNFGGPGGYTEPGIKLSTVAPNRVRVQYIGQIYNGFVEYQFNADNTAITEVQAYNGATTYAVSLQSFTLNTSTKSFVINWTFAGRMLTETWTRTGD
ncbi:MAG: DUF1735 domain-containing protein [Sphingobacteriaceae bacterium]|nr:MAG: DUF1735 domain-containing protein [Sphingobacteriaceae bacterium]